MINHVAGNKSRRESENNPNKKETFALLLSKMWTGRSRSTLWARSVAMPIAPTVVITIPVRMPMAPSIVITARTVSNVDSYMVTMMMFIIIASLSSARSEECHRRSECQYCRPSELLKHDPPPACWISQPDCPLPPNRNPYENRFPSGHKFYSRSRTDSAGRGSERLEISVERCSEPRPTGVGHMRVSEKFPQPFQRHRARTGPRSHNPRLNYR